MCFGIQTMQQTKAIYLTSQITSGEYIQFCVKRRELAPHMFNIICVMKRGIGINWVRQYFVNVVLFWIKNLLTSVMIVKLKSNVYVGPVNIFF